MGCFSVNIETIARMSKRSGIVSGLSAKRQRLIDVLDGDDEVHVVEEVISLGEGFEATQAGGGSVRRLRERVVELKEQVGQLKETDSTRIRAILRCRSKIGIMKGEALSLGEELKQANEKLESERLERLALESHVSVLEGKLDGAGRELETRRKERIVSVAYVSVLERRLEEAEREISEML